MITSTRLTRLSTHLVDDRVVRNVGKGQSTSDFCVFLAHKCQLIGWTRGKWLAYHKRRCAHLSMISPIVATPPTSDEGRRTVPLRDADSAVSSNGECCVLLSCRLMSLDTCLRRIPRLLALLPWSSRCSELIGRFSSSSSTNLLCRVGRRPEEKWTYIQTQYTNGCANVMTIYDYNCQVFSVNNYSWFMIGVHTCRPDWSCSPSSSESSSSTGSLLWLVIRTEVANSNSRSLSVW